MSAKPPELDIYRQSIRDTLDPLRATQLCAALDNFDGLHLSPPIGALPPLWHWLYFPNVYGARQSGLDGHRAVKELIPGGARRMWAGSQLVFSAPVLMGKEAIKTSATTNIAHKTGRSGPMVFVTVSHQISQHGIVRLREEHDIVYRLAGTTAATKRPAPTAAALPPNLVCDARIVPDAVLLFRYSALTHNSHRIHYDQAYCREVEGYPDLVVHGPLIATLLASSFLRAKGKQRFCSFAFRALMPAFVDKPIYFGHVPDEGGIWRLYATGPDNHIYMQAEASI